MADTRRVVLILLSLILAGTFLGGVFGPGVAGVSAATGDEDEINASIKAFTKLYHVVEVNSADKLNPDKAIYKGAIPGMLHTLDPHSSFFDPRDFQLLREDQRGTYFGVGMSVSERNRRTIVIAPFPGSPAYKAGLRPGDVILEVNGQATPNMKEFETLVGGVPSGSFLRLYLRRVSQQGSGSRQTNYFAIVRVP